MNRIAVTLIVATVVACSKPNDLEALQQEVNAIAVYNQPRLDALVDRVLALKRDLHSNPGWEDMLRMADLANDALGLPPFAQAAPPGASWKPSPASLLGIGGYVRQQAGELAKRGQHDELQFLVEDERRRYEQGITDVVGYLSVVESWLWSAHDATRSQAASPK